MNARAYPKTSGIVRGHTAHIIHILTRGGNAKKKDRYRRLAIGVMVRPNVCKIGGYCQRSPQDSALPSCATLRPQTSETLALQRVTGFLHCVASCFKALSTVF